MKATSRTLFRQIGPISLFALLATHCGAQPGDQQSSDELGGNEPGRGEAAEESVSEIQSGLIQQNTCRSSFTFNAASSLQTTVVPLGCARTSPGFRRGITVTSQTGGLANCFAQSQLVGGVLQPDFVSQSPRDGRVRTFVQAAPFGSGTCTVTVVENSDCAHAPCTTGTKLDATCSPNVAAICAKDLFCCTNSWDGQCVAEVATFAEESCN